MPGMLGLPSVGDAVTAGVNLYDATVRGGIADLRRMPTALIDEGPQRRVHRYLPPTGWEPGTYAFSVSLETVDPATGTAIELASAQSETSVTVQ